MFPNNYSGGGGGGAIVLSSTTQITVQSTGVIRANGGDGNVFNCDWRAASAGSGGAIRLVAPTLTNLGTIQATGGAFTCGAGTVGRIRLESFVTGVVNATTPAASIVTTPGPVTVASVPSLINLPTLIISTIGGQSVPATPGGSYTTADVTLPPGTTNPVTVTVTATNTTVPSTFNFKILPPSAAAPTPVTAASTGTFSSSTASANLTLPPGQISVLQVYGDFLLP